MNNHLLDVISVIIIGIGACSFILKNYLKMRKNKCATMCSSCSGGSCSTKNFANKSENTVISIKPIKWQ